LSASILARKEAHTSVANTFFFGARREPIAEGTLNVKELRLRVECPELVVFRRVSVPWRSPRAKADVSSRDFLAHRVSLRRPLHCPRWTVSERRSRVTVRR
jgi:hypothetical protein